jgi:RNA polymerase sigma factor (TIGR02999 family)
MSQSDFESSQSMDELFDQVYRELKQSAHGLRRRSTQRSELHTTQLVHELYLRMRQSQRDDFPSKSHFFAYAARAMRSIIIDQARSRISASESAQSQFELQILLSDEQQWTPLLALELEAVLKQLQQEDRRAAQVVDMHFFLGMSLPEIAEQLELTTRTVDRDWRFARSYLQSKLQLGYGSSA